MPGQWLPDADATRHWGLKLGACLAAGDVVCLEGPMGAGKTSMAQGILAALLGDAQLHVPSPTFALVNAYEGRLFVLHADLCRLTHASEVLELGLVEARAEGAVLLVEWGKSWSEQLGGADLWVELSVEGEGRQVRVMPGATLRGAHLAVCLGDATASSRR